MPPQREHPTDPYALLTESRLAGVAYLLFMDESGSDHQESPYEVLASLAVEDSPVLRPPRREARGSTQGPRVLS
jgi:hypothetical protein